ncbi:MAG TPA: amino acid ABC transporter permease, partial [Spirochaetia bacterium]|nr:amino acid ABC transporter permease [Spirochaetia bacterium]
YILKGCILTLEIYAITALFSVPLAVILALGKVSGGKVLKRILGVYAWIFRGTPLLLQLFFFYYGLTIFGISLSPMMAAGLTFVINYAAYLMEIFRAGIESIEKGQYEAARALNMNYWQTMRRIILPQTVKRVLPATCNEAINLVKDTALVTVIGMGDLLRAAKEIFTRDFTIIPFVIAAVVYLLMTSVIVSLFRRLERNFSYYL